MVWNTPKSCAKLSVACVKLLLLAFVLMQRCNRMSDVLGMRNDMGLAGLQKNGCEGGFFGGFSIHLCVLLVVYCISYFEHFNGINVAPVSAK